MATKEAIVMATIMGKNKEISKVRKTTKRIGGKALVSLFVATAIILTTAISALASPIGWSTDKVVVASGASSQIDMASNGNTVYVVYKSGLYIYMKTSTDGGNNWSAAVNVSSDIATQPQVSVIQDGTVYVAYLYDNSNIRVRRSTDNYSSVYATATPTVSPVNKFAMTHNPNSANVYLAWEEPIAPHSGSTRIYYGQVVLPAITGTLLTGGYGADLDFSSPRIAYDGSNVMVVYRCDDYEQSGVTDGGVYYAKINGGITKGFIVKDEFNGGNNNVNEYPDVINTGSGAFTATYSYGVYVNPTTHNYTVYARSYNSGWDSAFSLYSAGTTNPYAKTPANLTAIGRSGANLQYATVGTSTTLVTTANVANDPYAIAVANNNGEINVAYVNTSGAVVFKRQGALDPIEVINVTPHGGIYYVNGTHDFILDFSQTIAEWGAGNGNMVVGWNTINNSPWFNIGTTTNPSWQITVPAGTINEGTRYIHGDYTQTSDGKTGAVTAQLIVDNTNPTVSMTPVGDVDWTKNNVPITLTGAEESHPTWFDHCEYKINSGGWTTYTTSFNAPEGDNTISARSVDKAGNYSNTISRNIKIDKTKPTITITRPSGNTFEPDVDGYYRFAGWVQDSYSPVVLGQIYLDGIQIYQCTDPNAMNMAKVQNCSSMVSGTTHTIRVYGRDIAGNENSTQKTATVIKQSDTMSNWYFAEGNTFANYDEWITVQNIDREKTATITLDFQVNGQVVSKPVGNVGPESRATYNVRNVLGINDVDCAVLVKSTGAPVIVERPCYFNHHGWTGGHDTLGANTTSKNFYFAEGTTRNNANDGQFETYLVFGNFENSASTANVTYMLDTGENVARSYNVPAHSSVSVLVNNEIGNDRDFSTQVNSTGNIVAERVMYSNFRNVWTGGSVVIGTDSPATTWYFAEGCTQPGFEEYITLQNATNNDAVVTLEYQIEKAQPIKINKNVPAKSRGTVRVSDSVPANQNVSTKVTSNVPIVAERPMYFNYQGKWDGGHNNMGQKVLSKEWYLAEGNTYNWCDEWITLQNPDIGSYLTYVIYSFGDGSEPYMVDYIVGDKTRLTVNVKQDIQEAFDAGYVKSPQEDVSVRIVSDGYLVVERPMYFSYGSGGWTGGHIGSGYPMVSQ